MADSFERLVKKTTAGVIARVAAEAGDSDVKIMAVDYANEVDAEFGTKCGAKAVKLIAGSESLPGGGRDSAEDRAWEGGYEGWIGGEHLEALEVTAIALGGLKGITLIKPVTEEGYLISARSIHGVMAPRSHGRAQDPQSNARYAQSQGLVHEKVDWSVPGTAYLSDCSFKIAWDRNWQTRSV